MGSDPEKQDNAELKRGKLPVSGMGRVKLMDSIRK